MYTKVCGQYLGGAGPIFNRLGQVVNALDANCQVIPVERLANLATTVLSTQSVIQESLVTDAVGEGVRNAAETVAPLVYEVCPVPLSCAAIGVGMTIGASALMCASVYYIRESNKEELKHNLRDMREHLFHGVRKEADSHKKNRLDRRVFEFVLEEHGNQQEQEHNDAMQVDGEARRHNRLGKAEKDVIAEKDKLIESQGISPKRGREYSPRKAKLEKQRRPNNADNKGISV